VQETRPERLEWSRVDNVFVWIGMEEAAEVRHASGDDGRRRLPTTQKWHRQPSATGSWPPPGLDARDDEARAAGAARAGDGSP